MQSIFNIPESEQKLHELRVAGILVNSMSTPNGLHHWDVAGRNIKITTDKKPTIEYVNELNTHIDMCEK